ncbi:MAG: hypothetical protein N2688_10775 [Burkholderiaceae bacterium]|nr:hypothetical protein [Burkholderiaceae bacterium]
MAEKRIDVFVRFLGARPQAQPQRSATGGATAVAGAPRKRRATRNHGLKKRAPLPK